MVDVLVVLKEQSRYASTSVVVKGFVGHLGLQAVVVGSVEQAVLYDPAEIRYVLYFVSSVDADGLKRLRARGFQWPYPLTDTNGLVNWGLNVLRENNKAQRGHEINPPSTTR